jgi:hypothetical protein
LQKDICDGLLVRDIVIEVVEGPDEGYFEEAYLVSWRWQSTFALFVVLSLGNDTEPFIKLVRLTTLSGSGLLDYLLEYLFPLASLRVIFFDHQGYRIAVQVGSVDSRWVRMREHCLVLDSMVKIVLGKIAAPHGQRGHAHQAAVAEGPGVLEVVPEGYDGINVFQVYDAESISRCDTNVKRW